MKLWRMSLVFAAAVLLAACAQHAAIPYPETPAGETLRRFNTASPKDMQVAAQGLSAMQDKAIRKSLEPAMLAIVGREDSVQAVTVAGLLSEWEPLLPSSAPEFRHLLPTLARGLRNGNKDASRDLTRLPAVSGALMLGRMGPAAAYPIRRDMYTCFNAAVDKPIEGESPDCWTVGILGDLISCYGEDGVPALVKGLGHPDPWVRVCAIGGLDNHSELGQPEYWHVPADKLAVNTAAARAALPKIAERMWDADGRVRAYAAQAVGILGTVQTLTPKMRDRMMELFLDTRTSGLDREQIESGLAGLHPMFTPELLAMFDKSNDPHQGTASDVLRQIGAPIMPEMIARLGRDPTFAAPGDGSAAPAYWAHDVIRALGCKALPALKDAAANGADPVTRQRAQGCLDEIANKARAIVRDRLAALEHPTPKMNDDIVLMDLRDIQQNAAMAGPALAVLEDMARTHKNENVRTVAAEVAAQVRREQLDLP